MTLNYEWLRLMILDAILHKTQETEKIKKVTIPFYGPIFPSRLKHTLNTQWNSLGSAAKTTF